MPMKSGKYFIQSVDNPNHYVGTGPVPPFHHAYPAHLRIQTNADRDVYWVEPLGGEKYTLKTHNHHVGHDQDNDVRLAPYGSKPLTWALDQGNTNDAVRIRTAGGDKYWKVTGDEEYTPIRLEELDGSSSQEWRFIPYSY